MLHATARLYRVVDSNPRDTIARQQGALIIDALDDFPFNGE
jgi:hypothetical protein